MFNPMQLNPMVQQMMQRMQRNPMQMLQQSGYNVPQGMNDPNEIIRYLTQTGQVPQGQYDQFVKTMQRQWK